MERDKNYYEVWVKCTNCGQREKVSILKGVTVEDTPCPVCGCKALQLSLVY